MSEGRSETPKTAARSIARQQTALRLPEMRAFPTWMI